MEIFPESDLWYPQLCRLWTNKTDIRRRLNGCEWRGEANNCCKIWDTVRWPFAANESGPLASRTNEREGGGSETWQLRKWLLALRELVSSDKKLRWGCDTALPGLCTSVLVYCVLCYGHPASGWWTCSNASQGWSHVRRDRTCIIRCWYPKQFIDK